MNKKFLAVTLVLLFGCQLSAFAEVIRLPEPDMKGGMPLMQALANRSTNREFSTQPLEKEVLSELLWAASGINRKDAVKLTAPTARNWQEIDVYLTLPDGLYLYNRKDHSLEKKSSKDLRELAGRQTFTNEAPLNLVFVVDHERMTGADESAYVFYSAIDTGFISQNVYLYCASKGLNTVVLGLVDKEVLGEAMGLKPTQKVVVSQTVGYPVGREVKTAPEAQQRSYRDGTWRGVAAGYDADIEVDVVVKEGKITEVNIVKEEESAPETSYEVIPQKVIQMQGIDGVDAVSGATITAEAVLKAVDEALKKSE